MKKIYAIMLDEEDLPSNVLYNDVRIIAYLLYERLTEITEHDLYNNLLINSKNVIYNELMESSVRYTNGESHYTYRLLSDDNKLGKDMFYDPFIINENTFGITLNEEDINNINIVIDEVINEAFNTNIISKSYKYKLYSITYNKDSDRKLAINNINNNINGNINRDNSIKRLIKKIIC